jgi:hypothetical protein
MDHRRPHSTYGNWNLSFCIFMMFSVKIFV